MVEVSQQRPHVVDEDVGDDWPSEAEIEAEVARYLEVYERVKARRASDPDQDYVRYHMSALQLATRGMTPEERAEMFEFVIHYDLEPDDPVFLAYAAHGQVFYSAQAVAEEAGDVVRGLAQACEPIHAGLSISGGGGASSRSVSVGEYSAAENSGGSVYSHAECDVDFSQQCAFVDSGGNRLDVKRSLQPLEPSLRSWSTPDLDDPGSHGAGLGART